MNDIAVPIEWWVNLLGYYKRCESVSEETGHKYSIGTMLQG